MAADSLMTAQEPSTGPGPLAICVAPNGARRTKADHPALPMTTAEIAQEAAACATAGAGVIHLHVRDAKGEHSLDAGIYREAMDAISSAVPDLAIQVTTEAVGRYAPAQQMALVDELRPCAVSLALRELAAEPADELAFAAFLERTISAGVGVQYILYAAEEAARLQQMVRTGLCPEAKPHGLFVLGRYTVGQRSSPRDLLPFLESWPSDWPWTVCAFGKLEAQCMAAAVALGGNVRVGFENNLWLPDGSSAENNAALVANIAHLAAAMGRAVADRSAVDGIYHLNR
jgi:3-keto-5-aminohexanoate cleavage enzyme